MALTKIKVKDQEFELEDWQVAMILEIQELKKAIRRKNNG